MSTIALLSDFGTRDWYVGSMKGVILTVAPHATIIDITHDITPGDIRAGSFALVSSYSYFPHGTIFAAVIDPGVGSDRQALIARSPRYVFVGPDNGILGPCFNREEGIEVRTITGSSFRTPPIGSTFHGRDIFAPAAARYAAGMAFESFGPIASRHITADQPLPRRNGDTIEGEVVYIDRFGNAITTIGFDQLPAGEFRDPVAEIDNKDNIPLVDFYQQVRPGEVCAIRGSSGTIEISVNGGNAAERFGLASGSRVAVRPSEPR